MSEKKEYMTNRIVTEGYLQACERACGPLQGGASGSAVSFPTIEQLDVSNFELLPSGLRYPEYTNQYTIFITKDGNHKYYGSNYSSTLIHFDVQNNTSEELNVSKSGYLKCINDQTTQKYIYETKDGNNIFIGNTNYSGTILIKNHSTVEVLYSNETMSDFVEDNEGNVYFHGATSGVVKYNIEAGTKTQISTDNLLTKCDSKGNIYTYNSTTSKVGIVENNAITELTTSDTIYDFNIAESKDGYVYTVTSGYNNGQICYINLETKTLTLLKSMSTNIDYYTVGDDNCIYFSGGTNTDNLDFVCAKEGQIINITGLSFTKFPLNYYKAQDGSIYLATTDPYYTVYFCYVKDGVATNLYPNTNSNTFVICGETIDGTIYATNIEKEILEVKGGKVINKYISNDMINTKKGLAIIKDKDIYFYLPKLASELNIYQNNDYFNGRSDSLNCLYPAPFVNPYTDTLEILHTDTLEVANVNLFRQKEE